MFLLSFAVCTHQRPIVIPHSPHITFCLYPSFFTRWMPELKPQTRGLLRFLHRQGRRCLYTHKVFPYFSVYLNTQGHGPGCFFPLSTLLISTSQQFLDSSYSWSEGLWRASPAEHHPSDSNASTSSKAVSDEAVTGKALNCTSLKLLKLLRNLKLGFESWQSKRKKMLQCCNMDPPTNTNANRSLATLKTDDGQQSCFEIQPPFSTFSGISTQTGFTTSNSIT